MPEISMRRKGENRKYQYKISLRGSASTNELHFSILSTQLLMIPTQKAAAVKKSICRYNTPANTNFAHLISFLTNTN
jgi:hypothetical protein